MEIIFLPEAEEDLNYWIKTGNQSILKKITNLIENIQKNPFEGIGKPEPLKYNLTGIWSRRINREHHLIYEIVDERILIYSVKGHYK
jgi:toxin YoeB